MDVIGLKWIGLGRMHAGDANTAQFNAPFDCAIDRYGNYIVCDVNNNQLKKIAPSSGSALELLFFCAHKGLGLARRQEWCRCLLAVGRQAQLMAPSSQRSSSGPMEWEWTASEMCSSPTLVCLSRVGLQTHCVPSVSLVFQTTIASE